MKALIDPGSFYIVSDIKKGRKKKEKKSRGYMEEVFVWNISTLNIVNSMVSLLSNCAIPIFTL